MQNIGLVGLGFMGRTHLNAYQQIKNANVTAICTRRNASTETRQLDTHADFVTEYDQLLSDTNINIIDICLPTHLHEEYIIKAANAGKNIICEKPLTLTTESATRIVHAVNKNNVRLFVGHVLRFWPEYRHIKSYRENGKLKDINTVHAKRLSQAPKWSNWFRHPKKSGGVLFDLLIHDIDYIFYLLGEVDAVYAVGHKNTHGAWDHVITTLSLKSKSKAFAEASHRMPMTYPFTMSFRAQAEQGTLDYKVAAGENIENMANSNQQFIYYTDEEVSELKTDNTDPFQNQLSYFLDCLENNKDNLVIPLEDVLYTLRLLETIQQSLETDETIKMPW